MHHDNKNNPLISKTSEGLPEWFIIQKMPALQDIIELKVILYVFHCLKQRVTDPAFVTYDELLLSGPALLLITNESFSKALKLAVKDKIFLHSKLSLGDKKQDAYLVNSEINAEVLEQIKQGVLQLENNFSFTNNERSGNQSSNIFILYEQNIGMITPILSDELKAATELYPAQWIEEAFKEAVLLNKRSWRYIARILERWAREGKSIGADRPGNKEDSTNKYIKGKYGHLVRR